MSSFNSAEESGEQQFTDIEPYRKLVLQLFGLRRYKSALFWAEKTAVLSKNYPTDVYQLAQCMFMLKEYNRAAHIIKSSGLERTNLLCLALLVECLYDSKDYQEALDLLTHIDIEELQTSLQNDTIEMSATNNDANRNVSFNLSVFTISGSSSFLLLGYSIVTLFAQGKGSRING